MSDFNSSLPIRTENNGDVVARLSDGLTNSQLLSIDVNGAITSKIKDTAGNSLTSTAGSLNVNITGGSSSAEQHIMEKDSDPYLPGTTKGIVAASVVRSSVPSLTNGDFAPLTLSQAGRLIVDGSQVTQPVSGTVTANQGGAPWSVTISGQPITVLASSAGGLTINGSVSVSNFPSSVTVFQGTSPWVENLSQVGGQSISLGQKNGVSSVPVVIASDQSNIPVNLHDGSGTSLTSTGGALDVNIKSSVEANPLTKFNSTSALAKNATAIHETLPSVYPSYINGLWASASGKIKMELFVSPSGLTLASSVRAGVTYLIGFNSTATPNIDKEFLNDIIITTGKSGYLLITNDDLQAMDVYSTLDAHS